jgi:phenylpropionate dioxygenase-like ring-hydroxylating dioxygenase large terminal subunit
MLANDKVTVSTEKRPRVLEGIHKGLPNYWYPVLRSSEVQAAPVQLRRFGEDLVVWRDERRQPHIFENHCPHRGAALSLGQIQGNELACSYHGWRFNNRGECTAMPLEPESSTRAQRLGVKSYAAEDRAGYIWMFFGDLHKATPLSIPPEIEDRSWSMFRADYVWQTNWLNIMDNIMDPLHAIHLHTGAVTQRKRAVFKNFQVTQDNSDGFRLGKVGYREDGSIGPVEGEVEFKFPNVLRLDIADGTRQGIYRVIIMPTPIDDNRTCAFYVRGRRATGLKRLWWWIAWLAYYSRPVDRVAAQDGAMMSSIGPIGDARLREHMASSDIGLIHLRKRLNQSFFGAKDQTN